MSGGRGEEVLQQLRGVMDIHAAVAVNVSRFLRAVQSLYFGIEVIEEEENRVGDRHTSVEIHISPGDFYLDRNEYQAAAERYRTVLNQYPGLGLDAEGLYKLGVCYEHMRRDDEALRLYLVILENFRDTDLAESAAERIASFN